MTLSAKLYERCVGAAFWVPFVAALILERDELPGMLALAPLLALAIAGEELVVRQRQRPEGALLSFSAIAHVASVLVLGPLPAAAIAAVGVIIVDGTRRKGHRYLLVNSAMFGASTWVAGLVFVLAGGHPGHIGVYALPALFAAVAARYLVTSLIFAIGTSLASKTALSLVFRETVLEEMASAVQEGSLGILLAFAITSRQWVVLPFLIPPFIAIYRAKATYEQLKEETAAALESVAEVVDERDPSTAEHSERVAALVRKFTEAVGLPARESARLIAAGRFHDLGKIGVDVQTLASSERLSEHELKAIRRHPRVSARLLAPFHFAREMAHYVELHHERFDGHGYYAVPGDDVPVEAHVLIVADNLDAMTSPRAYRPALSMSEAAEELRSKAGTQFHPEIASVFAALVSGEPVEAALDRQQLAKLVESFSSIPVLSLPSTRLVGGRLAVLSLTVLSLLVFGLDGVPLWVRASVLFAAAACGAAVMSQALVSARRGRRTLASIDAGESTVAALAQAGVTGSCAWLEPDPDDGGYIVSRQEGTLILEQDLREACSRALRHEDDSCSRLSTGSWLVLASSETPTRIAFCVSRRPTAGQQRLLRALGDRLIALDATRNHEPTGAWEAVQAGSSATVRIHLDAYDQVRRVAGQLVAERVVEEAERRLRALLSTTDAVVRVREDGFRLSVMVEDQQALDRLSIRLEGLLESVPVPRRSPLIHPRIRAEIDADDGSEREREPLPAVG